jgi:putative membrane protein
MKLLVRWLIGAVALAVAARIVPGIRIEDTHAWVAVAVMAVILGFVNAIVRPLLAFLSCGLIVLTLGVFLLVINALMLALSSWIAVNVFDIGFYVNGFWAAFWGSIVVSIVTFLMSLVLPDDERR